MPSFAQSIKGSLEAEQPVVLATLLSRSGRGTRTHARMAVFPDGSSNGTIGGGAFEAKVKEQALACFESGTHGIVKIATSRVHFTLLEEEYLIPLFRKAANLEKQCIPYVLAQPEEGPGFALYSQKGFCYLTPNGTVDEKVMKQACKEACDDGKTEHDGIVTDFIGRKEHILFVGGGFVSEATARLAHTLGYRYDVIEPRPAYRTKTQFPSALSRMEGDDYTTMLSEFPVDEETYAVVTSHTVKEADIQSLLDRGCAYVGFLGSRVRSDHFHDRRMHTPIGLDLGGESPEEVALSIMAEINMTATSASGRQFSKGNNLVIVRGAGDLATGTIIRLHNAGYAVLALEIPHPTVIRRTVSFAEALFDGQKTVAGVTAVRIDNIGEAYPAIDKGLIPVLADPEGKAIRALKPQVLVDAIIAKKNLGTKITDAPLVVALGPGFTAGLDCHVAIETQRGHMLGALLREGSPAANTGVPGIIAGYGKERVIHSNTKGTFTHAGFEIGSLVQAGDTIAYVDGVPQKTVIGGMLRGLLREGMEVPEGFKVADVDPRGSKACYTLPSDKAMAIAGGVLEAVDAFMHTSK